MSYLYHLVKWIDQLPTIIGSWLGDFAKDTKETILLVFLEHQDNNWKCCNVEEHTHKQNMVSASNTRLIQIID